MKKRFKGTLFANPANITVRSDSAIYCLNMLDKWSKALRVPARYIIEDTYYFKKTNDVCKVR